MAGVFQGSLLDLVDQAGPGPLGGSVRRRALSHGAWVDVRPGWLAGADELFGRLLRAVPWRAERRPVHGVPPSTASSSGSRRRSSAAAVISTRYSASCAR